MSSKERREQLRLEHEARDRVRKAEEHRKAELSIWERIEEAEASPDVRALLHIFAEKLGLE
jgi:hypothetical protein